MYAPIGGLECKGQHTCCMDWKLRAEGATAEVIAGVMNSFWVFWPELEIFLPPNICEHWQAPNTQNKQFVREQNFPPCSLTRTVLELDECLGLCANPTRFCLVSFGLLRSAPFCSPHQCLSPTKLIEPRSASMRHFLPEQNVSTR